jgi:carboxyl-terminal processing protease
MRSKRVLWIIVILIAANSVLGTQVLKKFADTDKEKLRLLELIPEAEILIQNNYVEDVDSEQLVYGALRGMLNSLDLHSQFLPPAAVKTMEVDTTGRFGGLGIEITKKRGFVTVVSPIVDTPAYRAGLMSGDRIVKIDDEILRDPDLNEVVEKLRGEPGTKVTLMILRGQATFKRVTITRAIINVPSITEARMLEDSIGYVKVSQFQERTASDLHLKLTDLEGQGMDALILDLRDNPGGLLVSAVKVADLFLPGGQVIVSTRGTRKVDNQTYPSHGATTHPGYPMVVLINRASASGSEIVAGAIKDLKRGVIVGENSFGKGSVQTILRLGKPEEQMALRLTTAKYYTPSGVSIQDKGIEPHVVVNVTPTQEEQRRMQKYEEMEKALPENEGTKPDTETEKPLPESKKPLLSPDELETLTELPEEEEKEAFVDIQLREAVRILKAIKALGGGVTSPMAASAAR